MARNTSPQGSNPRADVQPPPLDDADWDQEQDEAAGHRARRLLSRSNSGFHRLGDRFGALSRWVAGERWVKRVAVAIAALMVIFAASFGALWLRLGAGPINLEMVDAMARRRDRGKYRPRQHGRGRRHPDRAGRPNPHRGAHPRHHRPGSRPCDRGERAESRGEAIGHGAADGAPSRREPQSGRCRTRGADHPGRLCHGLHRRQCPTARDRYRLEAHSPSHAAAARRVCVRRILRASRVTASADRSRA